MRSVRFPVAAVGRPDMGEFRKQVSAARITSDMETSINRFSCQLTTNLNTSTSEVKAS